MDVALFVIMSLLCLSVSSCSLLRLFISSHAAHARTRSKENLLHFTPSHRKAYLFWWTRSSSPLRRGTISLSQLPEVKYVFFAFVNYNTCVICGMHVHVDYCLFLTFFHRNVQYVFSALCDCFHTRQTHTLPFYVSKTMGSMILHTTAAIRMNSYIDSIRRFNCFFTVMHHVKF